MYVITAASGNTGRIIAQRLLENGKQVKVISRNRANVEDLVSAGAIVAEGNLEDEVFLTQAFEGATAVYAVIPPKWDLKEPWRNYQRRIATSITNALQSSKVPYVVALSSCGSHLQNGAGPVSGLYDFEQLLGGVAGLSVLALRPAFFMQNLYANIPLIKASGIFGYSLSQDVKMPFVHTNDIAEVALQRLIALDFKGFEKQFIAGDRDYTMPEVSEILSKAIGKEIQYVPFSKEELKNGMVSNGIPATIADGYNELFDALNGAEYLNDFERNEGNTTPTSVENFSTEFALAYQNG
ncbi:NmrA family NAD(P)-binding protein [Fulvivirga sp. 29W222]|uniref:NmrA family NAD(P)-binding protein n=1 Tax=Fulvivirga marina TaxID=2494733 RepID=A0A937KCX2_9BACT|nr:NmrA family NAD(P)-binding protein [Fulvivirga marina]MBL6445445.1 NmrA family NAD(P)-binding protein [Fulvivirga marina]